MICFCLVSWGKTKAANDMGLTDLCRDEGVYDGEVGLLKMDMD